MTGHTNPKATVYQVHDCQSSKPSTALAPLILIHGLGLSRKTWDKHVEALSTKRQVVTYDLSGHGQSAPPRQKPDLTVFADQIRDLMDELGIQKAVLVGFSLGGMINRRFAINYPDRVAGLVILNSPHERDPAAQLEVEARALASHASGPAANIDTTLARWFTEAFRESKPEAVQEIKNGVISNEAGVYADCRFVLANGVVELIRPTPPIEQPTLVMTCEHDTGSTPAMTHAIASEIADAETIIVPELQHMGLVEKPEIFTDAIQDFLDRRIPPEQT